MLRPDEQQRLLHLARRALEARVLRVPVVHQEPELSLPRGAFVSIHRRGELRGCLGRIEPGPLARTVEELARAVADSDPRFPPVAVQELPELDIEISVLTPESEISSPADIRVGRHGIIVEQPPRRGLLLPQVAVERDWDRVTFLEQTCVKAGLPRDAWRHGARVFVFEAHVFGERDARPVAHAGHPDVEPG